MEWKIGEPPSQFDKVCILLNNPTPSRSSYLRAEGFRTSVEEYEFFYETKSAYGFECPDETVRYVEAVNYHWECLAIIRREFSLTDREIAAHAFTIARSVNCTDKDFASVFSESILIEIEDFMEKYRRRKHGILR